MTFRLYSYYRSSASWRVRIGLGLKGVPFEYLPVHLLKDGGEHRKPEHLARNPMGQVPVLEIDEGGRTIRLGQSMAILDYLDRRFPEPAFLPSDPYLAARARQLAEIVNAGIQPLQNTRVANRLDALGVDKAAWNREWISEGMAALETETKEHAGRYAIGDRVTLPDLFIVPQMFSARRFGVDVTPFPTLARIERACNELPPFAAAHADRQPDTPPPG